MKRKQSNDAVVGTFKKSRIHIKAPRSLEEFIRYAQLDPPMDMVGLPKKASFCQASFRQDSLFGLQFIVDKDQFYIPPENIYNWTRQVVAAVNQASHDDRVKMVGRVLSVHLNVCSDITTLKIVVRHW